MNIMRKWWGSGGRMGSVGDCGDPVNSQAAQKHLALGLMHLKKLFSEYSYPTHPLSEPEKEDKLYNMLPLFCKVFGSSPTCDLQEKFADVLPFTQHVSKLMVTEIRRRASNQSTEAASCAIVRFLEIESCEESSNGWMLLSALNLLAAGPPTLIEVMTAASLPSTLVKCLYLFFDLPEDESPAANVADQADNNATEFSSGERRILLQKVFVQLMVRLCSHVAPAEELARKDDLTLLFSAITSWCPQHNALWRKSAAEVLMTLSRHGLSQPVVSYIHNKGCVALCVDNMERGQDLSPLEIVEMFVTVFCFLKDSSDVSQTLLDDFRSSQGYAFLAEFLLRLEGNTADESREALRNLVLLVSSLSYCGYVELKPSSASIGSLFHMPGFTLPVPSGRGASVRNVQAFNVLQSVFLRGTTANLCSVILDAISAVYHSDSANYFILEPQHTLSTFAEKIHTKPKEIQEKYFQLLEFVVFQLNFVPCKELISLSILLKAQHSLSCSIICINTLLTILKHNVIFKDVYREVGMLEVFVTCLSRYHELIKSKKDQDMEIKSDNVNLEERLGFLVMEALGHLLSANSQNAAVFRESGGAKCAVALVPHLECRLQSLSVMQQLILASGSDDDMGSLLGLLHSAPPIELQLKIDILKSLLVCLKESHRTRTVFRKVGGFVYVMSALVSLEGSLGDVMPPAWTSVPPRQILTLLLNVFHTLTTAMRFEPANAKFFHQEICYTSFCDTLRLLGCFMTATNIQESSKEVVPLNQADGINLEDGSLKTCSTLSEGIDFKTFHTIFTTPILDYMPPPEIPVSLVRVVQILQLMYHMALDAFDKASVPAFTPPSIGTCNNDNKIVDISPGSKRPVAGLNLGPAPTEPVIVHSGVVTALLHLLPSIQHPVHPQMACVLQLYTAHLIKSLVRTERNQQLMCESGLVGDLLTRCSVALVNEKCPLHAPLQYIFERLAAQAIHPRDLRIFLRLGDPLNCVPLDDIDIEGGQSPCNGPVPLTRIKTLVSMTTPRDFRVGTLVYPSFVEFDMGAEGFGCLFLPSIAPQSAGGGSVVGSALSNTEPNVIGGIGTGDRIFPPQTGLTFSTWVCVEKYSDPRTDPHCVRVLTLARHVPGRDHHLVCLSIVISARDKALIVSTHETNLPQPGQAVTEWEPEVVGDFGCRVWCPDLLTEGQWHHLTVSLSRSVLKNSSLCIYIDGKIVTQKKLHYILQNPGGGAANLTIASSVYAYVGTPPAYRRHSRLVWKQGSCLLVEDVLQQQMISQLHQLGPHYTGCLQAAQIPGLDGQSSQSVNSVAEEKVIFGLNASATSHLTLNKIRKMYSKQDNKSIAKQLGMSSHENATPIRVLHNSAGHLSGPSRSLGGVVIGYLGVRVFCPRPVAAMLDNVGGCSVLLGLVAMSKDVESLYAAVKALSCVIKTSKTAQMEMNQSSGYQTLALLLRKKKPLLNSHILHLCMTLAGSGEARESSAIPNTPAFNDLLCDLDVWSDAPGELCRTLLEHLVELAKESGERHANVRKMRSLGLVSRLLHLLYGQTQGKDTISHSPTNHSISPNNISSSNTSSYSDNNSISPGTAYGLTNSVTQTTPVIFSLLSALLANNPRPQDLLCFGQFIVSTLPILSLSEKHIELKTSEDQRELDNGDAPGLTMKNILLRNKCLEIMHTLLYNSNKNTIHLGFCEEVVKVLGLDWVLLFVQGHLHPSTVLVALRMLVALLSNSGLLQKYREASHNGGWMTDAQQVTTNKFGQVLGYSVGSSARSLSEIREDAWHMPGFQLLTWLVPRHIHIPQVYYLLLALLLGQPVKNVQNNTKLDLDSIWTFVFGVPASQCATTISGRVSLCPEAAIALLAMVRALLNQEEKGDLGIRCNPQNTKELPDWLQSYPVTLIQFLRFLYQQNGDFLPVFLSGDVLAALASTLFPYTGSSEPHSLTSPEEEKFITGEDVVIVKCETDGSLTNHPAKKQVMDFLKNLVVDSLSLPPASKGPNTIDLLLEATPENSSLAQVCEFQTQLLGTLMEHLLDADILIGEGAALPIVAGGSIQHIAPNVFYLAARIVDKLWAGVFSKDPHEVFDFIIKLISQAKRRASGINLESIYHCLNRTILYLLSRPADSIAAQMSILEGLHKLTTHRSVVFGAGNHEPDFVACLTYCLLQLTADIKINTEITNKSIWHVNPVGDKTDCGTGGDNANITNIGTGRDFAEATATQSHNLMITAATRVWEELYITKKPAIEEVFKVSLSAGSGKAPELSSVRDLVNEASQRLWLAFLEGEKKQSYRLPWEMPTQIQSVTNKLQKVTGGLTRLASRTKSRREDSIAVRKVNMSMADVQIATFTHISIIGDLVDLQHRQYLQKQKHMTCYLWESWERCERELTRERGLWGPLKGSHLDKWILDATEGPCRMRKKMVLNRRFYHHYPYKTQAENSENKQIKYKVATSFDSKEYEEKRRPEGLTELEVKEKEPVVQEEITNLPTDNFAGREVGDIDMQGLKVAIVKSGNLTTRSVSEAEDDVDALDIGDAVGQDTNAPTDDSNPDNQTLLRLLDYGEKISHMFRCARIQGLDTIEGLLLFGREHFYIVDGFTLLKCREIRDIASLPEGTHEPIIPSTNPSPSLEHHSCSKFNYDEIREVHQRRYLLQPIALEIFSSDGRNYLLALPRKLRNKTYQRLMMVCTGLADNAQQSVEGQRRSASVEQAGGLFSSIIGETSVTHRWVRGEISNFQYLMHLNTLAGRSYNDLMQYPIFPWVLADYTAEELDLTNPSTFRDLSKPMGAQTPDRLEQFEKRYREWDDPSGETPPYHYGTHYSSAMIVSSYLVRMEPFTQHFLRLQGGHFDLADRMFHSMKEAWHSASRNNMADVKELIPEFFYLPEFLLNSNKFDLGCKQNGTQLDDVVLPPWARGDAREFIRLHRAALECDYVSAHLHEWIDLIFGYKQHGQPAVEAVNVFHHLFYEGNVDIYNIDDPLKKNATIGFINNFGQIPKQLFRKPHPYKKMCGQRTSIIDAGPLSQAPAVTPLEKVFYQNLDNLRPTMHPVKDVKGAVGQIIAQDKVILAVEQNKTLIPNTYQRYLAWGFADHSLRIGGYESERAVLVCETPQNGEILAAVCPNYKTIITAGTSSVVKVYEIIKRQWVQKKCLYGHNDAITCLAASSAYGLLVSGSRDRTAIIWDLARLVYVRQLISHEAPVAALAINEQTGDIATCAGTWLYVWSINGTPIASVNTALGAHSPLQQILCVCFSTMYEWDAGNVIMTGSSDGVVRMWGIEYVQVPADELPENNNTSSSTAAQVKSSEADSASGQVDTRGNKRHKSPTKRSPTHPTQPGCSARAHEVVRRLSTVEDFPPALLTKSVSESSLSEEGESDIEESDKIEGDAENVVDLETYTVVSADSKKISTSEEEESPDKYSKEKRPLHRQVAVSVSTISTPSIEASQSQSMESHDDIVLRRSSNYPSGVSRAISAIERGGSHDGPRGPDHRLQTSKSETSLADSDAFVLISESEVREAKSQSSQQENKKLPKNPLMPGMKWACQLVFRSKLTMHTAYDRRDNNEPASVTALAVSKDHRTVLVGDARGRVFSWSVPDQPGRAVADHWVRDDGSDGCAYCQVKFSIYERRHHCRNCGHLFCSKCSRFESEISRLRILKPVRVCQKCYTSLKHDK
ncbi:WD repeat and FYVE domain-containing protein 3 isoform X2 [Palaemon carinicauda]|uniref:WD repeat and FYVE domain-containing protein 3 isoform X2 n=1 Tax=Palaemon carinicauda TaxID=392227 RepID=UPI0035B5ECA6